jgi:hypothetical protein
MSIIGRWTINDPARDGSEILDKKNFFTKKRFVIKFSDAMILALVFPNMIGLMFLFSVVKGGDGGVY